MTTIKQQMNAQDFERLRQGLRACFPDQSPLAEIPDPMVEGLVGAMWQRWDPGFGSELGVPPPPSGSPSTETSALVSDRVRGFVLAHARHARQRSGSLWDSFIGELPMVRLELAQSDRTPVPSPLGQVDEDSALYFTVDEFNLRLRNEPGFKPAARVELTTAPRLDGERFAAIGVYLSYAAADDPEPQAYLLEAGLAQGGPRVPFYGETMNTVIERQTGYQPTPMSQPSHWYRGELVTSGSVLRELHIASRKTLQDPPYIQVDVRFESLALEQMPRTNPAIIRLGAVARVAAVMDSLGMSAGNPLLDIFLKVLATYARAHLPWAPPPP